jgi:ABC-type molybdate transport system permease subunit
MREFRYGSSHDVTLPYSCSTVLVSVKCRLLKARGLGRRYGATLTVAPIHGSLSTGIVSHTVSRFTDTKGGEQTAALFRVQTVLHNFSYTFRIPKL